MYTICIDAHSSDSAGLARKREAGMYVRLYSKCQKCSFNSIHACMISMYVELCMYIYHTVIKFRGLNFRVD